MQFIISYYEIGCESAMRSIFLKNFKPTVSFLFIKDGDDRQQKVQE